MSVPTFDIFEVITATLPIGQIPATYRDIQKIFAGFSTEGCQNGRVVFKKSKKNFPEKSIIGKQIRWK